ncbi:MAG: peptidoglycan editing factor PgeF [Myxococcales bacterium]|nr:peptidoglycan editing factor PgeF [Myxococcales bacterium]
MVRARRLQYHAQVLLRSSALDIAHLRHAFSTRKGGTSVGPYASLNLSYTVGDQNSKVTSNRHTFASEALFGDPQTLGEITQIHGINVVKATWATLQSGELRQTNADALWTSEPGLAVAVTTADCAPILLVALAPGGQPKAVAAIHAGWRSAVMGIVHHTIRSLVDAGYQPAHMRAAIGPTIGPQAFEVGEEVILAASESLGPYRSPKTQPGPRGRPLLDLAHLVHTHLKDVGVGNVDTLGRCTISEPELFFSHRRDQGRTGRHLSAIQIVQ